MRARGPNSRSTSILTLGLAALVAAATVSCQPHPSADDESLRTLPTTITHDHHPPPRMSEP